MTKKVTGVILAGGQNSRMNGTTKAHLNFGDKRIIDRTLELFSSLFESVLLVTNTPEAFLDLDVPIVTDVYQKRSSLAGIHTGLFHAETDWIFTSPCDAPFLKAPVIETVVAAINDKVSVVVPETDKGFEPLFAAYSKTNLKKIETNILEDKLKVRGFYKPSRTRTISEKKLRSVDASLVSFYNINTPEAYETALEMAGLNKS